MPFKQCKKCGEDNSMNALYCVKCGTSLRDSNQKEPDKISGKGKK